MTMQVQPSALCLYCGYCKRTVHVLYTVDKQILRMLL